MNLDTSVKSTVKSSLSLVINKEKNSKGDYLNSQSKNFIIKIIKQTFFKQLLSQYYISSVRLI